MKGIPYYAYWAALLDPCAKVKTSRILSQRERGLVWKDIQYVIFFIAESHASFEAAPAEEVSNNDDGLLSSTEKNRRKWAASFIINAGATMESRVDSEDFLSVLLFP